MSRVAHHKLGGYVDLPEWAEDPTDSSLRESDIGQVKRASPPRSFASAQTPTATPPLAALAAPRPVRASATQTPVGSSPASSVPHTTRATFRDLDDFLNSDGSEEETEEESSEEEVLAVNALSRPTGALVLENVYAEDVDTEDESSEEEETSEEEEVTDEEGVDAPLFRR